MTYRIRVEAAGDRVHIAAIITEAFKGASHSDGSEAAIVERLRDSGALTLSLVAETEGIVGHIAFSPVTIDGIQCGWFGLAPLAVVPEFQGSGIGIALVENGLEHLRTIGAAGCVVLGEPSYYGRFGFTANPALTYPGPPAEYFQSLVLSGELPEGVVAYHPAFG